MSRRAIIGGAAAAIAIIAVVLFWTTAEREQEEVASAESTPEQLSLPESVEQEPSLAAASTERRDWFPDLGSTGGAVNADGERDSFNCDMDRLVDPLPLLSSADSDDRRQSLDQLRSVLSSSGDAEMLLAASGFDHFVAIVDGQPGMAARLPNLERALAADPMNPVVLWDVAQYCGIEPESEICGQAWLRANVDTALGGNGEYWAREAMYRYAAEDTSGALAALRRAASAPEFDDLVIARTRVLERALSAAPDIGYQERAITAYAMSSGIFASSNPGLFSACSTEAWADPVWWDACLDFASRLLADGRTLDGREMGARLQVRLYDIRGEDELRAAAEETRDWLDDADLDDAGDDVVSVVLTDERVLRGFLDEFESSSELSAAEWLYDEVARLKQDPEYDPCPEHKDAS